MPAPALAFAAVAAVGALTIGVLDTRLYGSPLATGYDLTDGFALRYVPTNARHYSVWLLSAEPALAIGLVAVFVRSRARALLLSTVAVVWTIYLLYVPWDAWWYLRFLLPTWPAMAIGTASIVARAGCVSQVGQPGQVRQRAQRQHGRRHSPRDRIMRGAGAALIVATGVSGVWQAYRRDTFNAARGEAKYVEVARAVEAIADPDAVIISAQHSGSIRYYSGRLTLRWDVGDPAWLDRTVDWLAAHGHHPYFVLEPHEIADLRERYGRSSASARLDWTPMVVFRRGAVVMFDAVRRETTGAPVEQPELARVRDCPMQRPWPALRELR